MTMEPDLIKKVMTPSIKLLGDLFQTNGYQIRIVGGAVRDLLMGQHPTDTDMATDATPQQVIDLLLKADIRCVPTGLQHGTVSAVIDKEVYEITTLRIDEVTDGRHAEVVFTQDWKLDAERRDLTINAMSIDFEGKLYDYYRGRQHLTEGKVLFVGDAKTRIQEDYLRILRYFRFHGRICSSQSHDSNTLDAIRANATGLHGISGERIWSELSKLLSGNNVPGLVTTLYEVGVAVNICLPADGAKKITIMEEVRKYSRNPISVLVTLMEDTSDFLDVFARYKFSSNEKNLGLFLIKKRDTELTFKSCSDDLVDGVQKEMVKELCRYKGRLDLAEELSEWPIPRFPVSGTHLKNKGIRPGRKMGVLLHQLKSEWKASHYKITLEELLEHVHI